jgi:uncharacterized protein YraI
LKNLRILFSESNAVTASYRTRYKFGLLLLLASITLSGCGIFDAPEEATGPLAIRTPKPTFTPTVPVAALPDVTPTPPSSGTGDQADPAASAGADRPKAVINAPLVNARSGPSTDDEIVATVERGAEYDIVGISPDRSWWNVCCIDGAQAWVINEYVDTLGAVDSVPVVGGPAEPAAAAPVTPGAAPVTPAAADTAATTAPVPTTAPAINFNLENQEQFPETGLVRIFLYVYSGNSALEGYSLRVTKDGTELPVEGTSFGGQPAFTWPFQDPRQRFQNLKVEYPDTEAQGVWQVQLIDNTGATVGPPATFTLSNNDPQQELYVRYAQR